MSINWHGVFPALTTQFGTDQALDIPATLRHLEAILDSIHGVILLGTVGENCSLEHHEKIDLLRATSEQIGGRCPVLAGVAEYTTPLACRFAEEAQRAGVDGLMVLPAMVYKADSREAAAHFRSVARATDLPIMIYNNPVSYKVDLTPDDFVELADEANLVAIKESSENPRRITEISRLCGQRYALFCGVDDLVFEAAALGADGWVAGLVNGFPRETRLLWDLLATGKIEEARAVYRWFTPLLQLDTHPKLVQYIKLAASVCGYGSETVRSPRLALIGEERDRILRIIDQAIETRPVDAIG